MNQLVDCFKLAKEYPKATALLHHQTYDHFLEALKKRLDSREEDLFCSDADANVHGLRCRESQSPFVPGCVKSYDDLRTYFGFKEGQLQSDEDAQSQFIFIHAQNSRDRLRVTREMLMALLTYYQVMPAFLDFVFPFGKTADARDFFYSGFKHETRLSKADRGLRVDPLSRSGLRLQVSYSLWAPAKTNAFQNWEWSVQPMSIYHSFDFETGRMLWILIKGDPKIKDQVASAIESPNHPQLRRLGSRDERFATSLATHESFKDWVGENWLWYVNFLEEKVQEITDRTLNVTINKDSVVAALRASSQATGATSPTIERSQTWTTIQRAFTWRKEAPPILPTAQPRPAQPPVASPARKLPRKLPPGVTAQQQERKPNADEFDIDDIRKVERVEERTNAALLILRTQISVMTGLLEHYGTILHSKDAPKDMAKNCEAALTKFQISITGAVSEMQLHQSRLETLSRLLAERKTLMSSIIEYQSMQASSWLAAQAKESSEKMETMTRRMERIAEQTQKETVSMKVITVITLIFLPGTFVSTLMSTDIVTFQNQPEPLNHKVVSLGALHLFLEISFILMALTVLMWVVTNFALNWWQKRQWDKAEVKGKASAASP
ncbi:hypothetical protein EDD37DRAFT_455481 [Exophiala viscosa]|uniref:uncharacterized protein n=1 Tax=Exophiala viscosa TaxID=2486360 RepID=UPI002195CECE|nr:hypothetical protein EDD37DRAFT_455481 [Exophiala viscosa]